MPIFGKLKAHGEKWSKSQKRGKGGRGGETYLRWDWEIEANGGQSG